jgi:hypothetical protein
MEENHTISNSVQELTDIIEEHLEAQSSEEDTNNSPNTSEENFPDILPQNSPTLLIDETTSRFSSAIWYNEIQNEKVILAGVGGIGSYVGFLLGRLKINRLILFDPDRVEIANMSGQFYGASHLGAYKVNALASALMDYAHFYSTYTNSIRYRPSFGTANVMICGFDNMGARKIFFNAWKQRVEALPLPDRCNLLFIDGRLAAEEFQVFAIQGNDTRAIKEYEENWLFDDSEAEETICSYKQTSFMANMIASIMVNIFVNFEANKCNPIVPRDIPFYTSYDASTMFIKMEM